MITEEQKLEQVKKAAKQLIEGIAEIKANYPYTEKDRKLVPAFMRMRMWNHYYLQAVEMYRKELYGELLDRKK